MIAKRSTMKKRWGLDLNLSTKRTRKREFLDEMNQVVPWAALMAVIEPHSPRAKTGRPPFAIETMLRIHYRQQCAKGPTWTRGNAVVGFADLPSRCVPTRIAHQW